MNTFLKLIVLIIRERSVLSAYGTQRKVSTSIEKYSSDKQRFISSQLQCIKFIIKNIVDATGYPCASVSPDMTASSSYQTLNLEEGKRWTALECLTRDESNELE